MLNIARWRTTFTSLQSPTYRWYWLSSTASSAVWQMNIIARGWLVYDITGSALALGWVSFGVGVPLLLMSPFGGAVADRMDKRDLILNTQVLLAVAVLAIAMLISMGVIAVWHLVIASIVQGLLISFNAPSRQSIVPQLVEHGQVMNAVALNSGSINFNRVIAPALGGVLIGFAGIESVYFLMVALALVSAFLMMFVPKVQADASGGWTDVGYDIVEGIRYTGSHRLLRALLLLAIVPILFGMPYMTLLPVFSEDVFDVGSTGLGYLMAAAGMGAVFGSMFVASLSDFRYKGALLLIALALFGITLIFFAGSANFYLALFFLIGVGMANAVYMAVNNSLLLLNSEARMRGRVMSLYMVSVAAFPLAVLPAGAIIEVVGAPWVVGACGAIIVIFALAMSLLSPGLRRL